MTGATTTVVGAMLLATGLLTACRGAETGTSPEVDSTSSAVLEQALAALQAANYGRALALAERVESRRPGLTETNYVMGQIFYDLGMYDRAGEYWQEVVRAEPNYWLWHHNLGEIAFRKSRFKEAAEHYRRAAELDPNPVSLHGLASTYWELGLTDSTGAILQRALAVDSAYAPVYLSLSNYAEERGELDDARRHAHRALSLDSSKTAYHQAAGVLDLKAESREEAMMHLERVLDVEPTNHTALYNYGLALQRLGKEAEAGRYLDAAETAREQERALQLLREAVANNPTSPSNQIALAQTLQATGHVDDALHAYKAADLLAPGNTRLRHTIATLHLQRGDLLEAARRYRAIIASDTTLPEAWLNLGVAYARMDSMNRARAIWTEAGERFPDHADVRRVLDRVDG